MRYYPKYAVWELSLKCNMRCIHCGSRAGNKAENELSTDERLDIAKQLIEMGNEEITLIGGEIFLVPEWYKIAKMFSSNGVKTKIITNAYIMGQKQIDELNMAGVDIVGISLDGMEHSHNSIRGRNDSFQRVEEAIKKLKNHGFKVGIVTTVMRSNLNDLEDMYQFLKKHGVDVWQIQLASPMGNAKDKFDLLIDPDEVKNIIKFILDKRAQGPNPITLAADNVGYFPECGNIRGDLDNKKNFAGCAAGLFNIGIDSVGNVKGCESLQDDCFIEGNLRKRSLKDIWNDENAFAYNRKFNPSMLSGKCSTCEKGNICAAGCRNMSFFSTGKLYENIYCCK